MANICLCCNKEFLTRKSLHLHISKGEKISLSDYYHMFFPRKDLLTGDFIKFKDFDQYFESYFNHKENLNYWFVNNWHKEKAVNVAKDILKNRAEKKKLKYSPCQVELRTIMSPTVNGMQKMFDYNEFCLSLGIKNRFKYGFLENIQKPKDLKILIDTREQNPFKFPNSKISKLDVGDYTADEPDYSDVFVERKSIQDFFGTFYNEKNLERFKKEVSRAERLGLYLVVVVEATLNACLDYKTYFVKDKNFSSHTFKNVRDLLQQFGNLQFAFSYNKFTAQQLVLWILSQGDNITNFDIQYLIDTKQI